MNKQINPAVGIVIGVVVVIVIGLVSWKMFGKPAGVTGTVPAMYSNPTGANAPEPAGAVKGNNAPTPHM